MTQPINSGKKPTKTFSDSFCSAKRTSSYNFNKNENVENLTDELKSSIHYYSKGDIKFNDDFTNKHLPPTEKKVESFQRFYRKRPTKSSIAKIQSNMFEKTKIENIFTAPIAEKQYNSDTNNLTLFNEHFEFPLKQNAEDTKRSTSKNDFNISFNGNEFDKFISLYENQVDLQNKTVNVSVAANTVPHEQNNIRINTENHENKHCIENKECIYYIPYYINSPHMEEQSTNDRKDAEFNTGYQSFHKDKETFMKNTEHFLSQSPSCYFNENFDTHSTVTKTKKKVDNNTNKTEQDEIVKLNTNFLIKIKDAETFTDKCEDILSAKYLTNEENNLQKNIFNNRGALMDETENIYSPAYYLNENMKLRMTNKDTMTDNHQTFYKDNDKLNTKQKNEFTNYEITFKDNCCLRMNLPDENSNEKSFIDANKKPTTSEDSLQKNLQFENTKKVKSVTSVNCQTEKENISNNMDKYFPVLYISKDIKSNLKEIKFEFFRSSVSNKTSIKLSTSNLIQNKDEETCTDQYKETCEVNNITVQQEELVNSQRLYETNTKFEDSERLTTKIQDLILPIYSTVLQNNKFSIVENTLAKTDEEIFTEIIEDTTSSSPGCISEDTHVNSLENESDNFENSCETNRKTDEQNKNKGSVNNLQANKSEMFNQCSVPKTVKLSTSDLIKYKDAETSVYLNEYTTSTACNTSDDINGDFYKTGVDFHKKNINQEVKLEDTYSDMTYSISADTKLNLEKNRIDSFVESPAKTSINLSTSNLLENKDEETLTDINEDTVNSSPHNTSEDTNVSVPETCSTSLETRSVQTINKEPFVQRNDDIHCAALYISTDFELNFRNKELELNLDKNIDNILKTNVKLNTSNLNENKTEETSTDTTSSSPHNTSEDNNFSQQESELNSLEKSSEAKSISTEYKDKETLTEKDNIDIKLHPINIKLSINNLIEKKNEETCTDFNEETNFSPCNNSKNNTEPMSGQFQINKINRETFTKKDKSNVHKNKSENFKDCLLKKKNAKLSTSNLIKNNDKETFINELADTSSDKYYTSEENNVNIAETHFEADADNKTNLIQNKNEEILIDMNEISSFSPHSTSEDNNINMGHNFGNEAQNVNSYCRSGIFTKKNTYFSLPVFKKDKFQLVLKEKERSATSFQTCYEDAYKQFNQELNYTKQDIKKGTCKEQNKKYKYSSLWRNKNFYSHSKPRGNEYSNYQFDEDYDNVNLVPHYNSERFNSSCIHRTEKKYMDWMDTEYKTEISNKDELREGNNEKLNSVPLYDYKICNDYGVEKKIKPNKYEKDIYMNVSVDELNSNCTEHEIDHVKQRSLKFRTDQIKASNIAKEIQRSSWQKMEDIIRKYYQPLKKNEEIFIDKAQNIGSSSTNSTEPSSQRKPENSTDEYTDQQTDYKSETIVKDGVDHWYSSNYYDKGRYNLYQKNYFKNRKEIFKNEASSWTNLNQDTNIRLKKKKNNIPLNHHEKILKNNEANSFNEDKICRLQKKICNNQKQYRNEEILNNDNYDEYIRSMPKKKAKALWKKNKIPTSNLNILYYKEETNNNSFKWFKDDLNKTFTKKNKDIQEPESINTDYNSSNREDEIFADEEENIHSASDCFAEDTSISTKNNDKLPERDTVKQNNSNQILDKKDETFTKNIGLSLDRFIENITANNQYKTILTNETGNVCLSSNYSTDNIESQINNNNVSNAVYQKRNVNQNTLNKTVTESNSSSCYFTEDNSTNLNKKTEGKVRDEMKPVQETEIIPASLNEGEAKNTSYKMINILLNTKQQEPFEDKQICTNDKSSNIKEIPNKKSKKKVKYFPKQLVEKADLQIKSKEIVTAYQMQSEDNPTFTDEIKCSICSSKKSEQKLSSEVDTYELLNENRINSVEDKEILTEGYVSSNCMQEDFNLTSVDSKTKLNKANETELTKLNDTASSTCINPSSCTFKEDVIVEDETQSDKTFDIISIQEENEEKADYKVQSKDQETFTEDDETDKCCSNETKNFRLNTNVQNDHRDKATLTDDLDYFQVYINKTVKVTPTNIESKYKDKNTSIEEIDMVKTQESPYYINTEFKVSSIDNNIKVFGKATKEWKSDDELSKIKNLDQEIKKILTEMSLNISDTYKLQNFEESNVNECGLKPGNTMASEKKITTKKKSSLPIYRQKKQTIIGDISNNLTSKPSKIPRPVNIQNLSLQKFPVNNYTDFDSNNKINTHRQYYKKSPAVAKVSKKIFRTEEIETDFDNNVNIDYDYIPLTDCTILRSKTVITFANNIKIANKPVDDEFDDKQATNFGDNKRFMESDKTVNKKAVQSMQTRKPWINTDENESKSKYSILKYDFNNRIEKKPYVNYIQKNKMLSKFKKQNKRTSKLAGSKSTSNRNEQEGKKNVYLDSPLCIIPTDNHYNISYGNIPETLKKMCKRNYRWLYHEKLKERKENFKRFQLFQCSSIFVNSHYFRHYYKKLKNIEPDDKKPIADTPDQNKNNNTTVATKLGSPKLSIVPQSNKIQSKQKDKTEEPKTTTIFIQSKSEEQPLSSNTANDQQTATAVAATDIIKQTTTDNTETKEITNEQTQLGLALDYGLLKILKQWHYLQRVKIRKEMEMLDTVNKFIELANERKEMNEKFLQCLTESKLALANISKEMDLC